MTKHKPITSKVVVGIICAILILSSVIMLSMLLIFKDGIYNPTELTPTYDNLPNVMGDSGVYVSKNFFTENGLEIPQWVTFYHVSRSTKNSVYIKDKNAIYDGRVKELEYGFGTNSQKNSEQEEISLWFSFNLKNIEDLQNIQKHNGHTYGLAMGSTISKEDSQVMITHFVYSVNFNRNENTSKKCQLTMDVKIEHNKDISSEEYKE